MPTAMPIAMPMATFSIATPIATPTAIPIASPVAPLPVMEKELLQTSKANGKARRGFHRCERKSRGGGVAQFVLDAQPFDAHLRRPVLERLLRLQLVALAKTPCRLAARAEDGFQVIEARLVGRDD